MKPKVCYILPLYEEGTDTHFFYNYLLIREASKKMDMFVIVEKCSKLGFEHLELGEVKYYIQKFKFPPLRFLEILWICFKLHASGHKNFYIHYSYYGALAALLATWRPCLAGRQAGRQVKIFYWNRGMPWLFRQNWLKEKLFRFILRRTILVTGPESLAKEYVKRYGVKEYHVLSNWIDVNRFAPTGATDEISRWGRAKPNLKSSSLRFGVKEISDDVPAGARNVLFVHHLSKRKGADLIPIIAEAFREDNVKFVVIGDGPEFENCKLEIENLGLKHIELLGKKPNDEVVKYLKNAHIFLMPSREEGSPRVLLEAMASGTPFVASDVGGVRELVPVEERRYLCKSEDVECFQEKIKKLLSDQQEYARVRSGITSWVRQFGKERGVKEFIGLFNENKQMRF